MRTHAGWLGIFAAVLAMTVQADVPNDPKEVKPLAVGMKAPAFQARTTDGALRTFTRDGYQKPTIVIFYRGGWCPYCNTQLSDLRLVEPKLRQSGFEIVFLSTDRPEILYSSLKATDIHYTLLSDGHLDAAKAFHIAYHVDPETLAMQKKFGVDLDVTTGEPLHELPVPSVFIIDRSGVIRFVYSNPDYRVRLGADALWTAAAPYASSNGR
jgi:peroxiredoxin